MNDQQTRPGLTAEQRARMDRLGVIGVHALSPPRPETIDAGLGEIERVVQGRKAAAAECGR